MALLILPHRNGRPENAASDVQEETVKKQGKPGWIGSRRLADTDDRVEASAPPLSERDRYRLLREWTDANTLGDDEARRSVEDEILGRVARPGKPTTGTDTQNR
jgi:hypothetical protein